MFQYLTLIYILTKRFTLTGKGIVGGLLISGSMFTGNHFQLYLPYLLEIW